MVCQWPRRQLHIVLQTLNSLPLPPPKEFTHARHPLRVGHLQVPSNNLLGLTHHPNCFLYVGMEAHPVKKNCQAIQHSLEPGCPGQGEKAAVGVKERRQPLDLSPKDVRSRFLPCHQCDPVTNHHYRHHVKDGGRERTPLSDSSVPLEQVDVVTSHSGHYWEVIPVVT